MAERRTVEHSKIDRLKQIWREFKEIANLVGVLVLASIVSLIPIKERKE